MTSILANSKNMSYPRKGTLEFYGLEGASKNQSHRLVVLCNGRAKCHLEVAKDEQLALYYDGWLFFLRKAPTAR
jgi:hypothetical protein